MIERVEPEAGHRLRNFWGYSPIGFFAPKAAYASDGRYGSGARFDSTPTVVREGTTDDKGRAILMLDPTIEPTAQPRHRPQEGHREGAGQASPFPGGGAAPPPTTKVVPVPVLPTECL